MATKSKESVVVVLFILMGIIVFVILFFGLSGNITGKKNFINIMFNDVSGLRVGDPVYVRGVEVGTVRKVALMKDRVLVKVGIDPDVLIPKDSKCYLSIQSYFSGDMYINIQLGSDSAATSLDTLVGRTSIMNIEAMFNQLANSLNRLNLDSLSSQIGKEGRLLVSEIQKGLKGSFSPITSSLDRIMLLTGRIDSLFNGLDRKEGTVSKLLNSSELYDEIIMTNKELRTLIQDIKANPKRYFKIEVF
ncbi:MAG: MlaD family protein [candidate division WOR-3 bacterium]